MKRGFSCRELRQDPFFLRNDFAMIGKYGMPRIKKYDIDISGLQLIGADKIHVTDESDNIFKTVHFFIEDHKLDRYYNQPRNYLMRLAQYPHVITPDYSLYTDMPMALQIYNTFKNRWCGAYWQENGLSVIPSVSWSTEASYEFCFDGLEYGTVVAISTVGGLTNKDQFLRGYFEMKKRIDPKQTLCFGKAFTEMEDDVIVVSYLKTTGRGK